MNNKTGLSIVIPVYKLSEGDNSAYFELLIRSIAANTASAAGFKLNELIIINDDPLKDQEANVNQILKTCGLEKSLIYFNNETNRGQGFCRNFGAAQATGDYLHFIDQDDLLSDGFYTALFKEGKSAAFILSDLWFFTDRLKRKSYYKAFTQAILKKATLFKQLSFLLFSNIAVSPGQYLIKRALFNAAGKFPDLQNKGSDDFGLLFKLAAGQLPVEFKFCPEAKFIYRIHPAQGSKNLILNNSVNEYLLKHISGETLSAVQKLIRFVRLHKSVRWFNTLFYLTFFNRA